jgi:hypothetical protein
VAAAPGDVLIIVTQGLAYKSQEQLGVCCRHPPGWASDLFDNPLFGDKLGLTEMLGMRRAGVTDALQGFEAKGLIERAAAGWSSRTATG